MISPLNDAVFEVAALLLAATDAAERASLLASAIVEVVPDTACAIHRFTANDPDAAWTAIGVAGDLSIEQTSMPTGDRLMSALLTDEPRVLMYRGSDLRREDYSHLHIARSVASLAYLPLLDKGRLIGCVELLSFSKVLDPEEIDQLAPILQLAPPAILAAEEGEEQRQNLLDSIHRMSQLYDLEKTLNSTLEFDAVTTKIPEKAQAMLACQAVHLWLFDGGALRLISTYGEDATVEVGDVQSPGQGYVGDMAEDGEPLLIDDPEDQRLILRNAAAADDTGIPPVSDVLLAPLLQDESEVGVLEAINKEGRPFDDDDQFLFTSMAETVSSALKNASLLLSERKLEILEALVKVSSEITSTLRLDRLLQIIVNSPQNVLPYELCAIALDNRGRLQLKAVSGMSNLPLGDAQVGRLQELMRWLSSEPDSLHLNQREETGAGASANLPSDVALHFEQTGYRSLYSLPLADDQGRVGLLLYESSEPDFLGLPHTEMIKILAGQATVAIRNALLYREVPLISLIEPLARQRAALMRTSLGRRLAMAVLVASGSLFLALCPLPMRISGDAIVAPQHIVTIAAPVDGIVDAVYAHEGQRVAAGDVLGGLNDWQWRTDLAASEAKYQQAMLVMEDDLAHATPQAGADRAQTEYFRSEVERGRTRLDSAKLRSPIAGIVVTPNLQNAAGEHLDAGAPFAQVLDLSSAVFQIAVPQRDAVLVHPGQIAAIKLDSYPRQTWHDHVSILSPEAQAGDGERTFSAEVPIKNPDATLRAGMTGRAKIFIGWRPAGYVLLRRPALWAWQTIWNWIGW